MQFLVAIRAVFFLAAIFSASADAAVAANINSNLGGTTWRQLRVGAGGWLTGIDISSDGSTRVVRSDTYGAYIWDAPGAQWMQLVTTNSMPVADIGVDSNAGVYEIRVAPSRSTRLFMAFRGYVYRSDDRGGRWIRTSFANVPMDPNDDFRMLGQKMAVDPANPDVVYAGTPQNGLFVSDDGGSTWQNVSAVPRGKSAGNGKHPGITGIAFDPHLGTTDDKTKIIYASSYGNGVYRSADAGASWTHLADGPNNVSHGKVATDGAYYVTGNDSSSVWRYFSEAWTNVTPAKDLWTTVITDPFDAAHIIAVRAGGYLDISHDRGTTWSGIIWGPNGHNNRVATDVPWLAWTNDKFMAEGDLLFDPVVPGRLWFAEGVGVWYADPRNAPKAPTSSTFTSQSMGIEQLVANQIIAPPGGKPVLASWDRPVFYVNNPDTFPSIHGPDNQHSILMGWALDYASTNPAFIVGLFNWWGIEKSAFSTDGGQSWTPFAAYPPTIRDSKIGGSIAASTTTNIVWAPSNNSPPYFTKDGGHTWIPISIEGVPSVGETGWGFAYYLKRYIVAADRVIAGTFYIYNNLKGLYRSTDGGGSWTLVHPGEIAHFSGFNAKLASVPGQVGHLFFTSGPLGNPRDKHPVASPFMRSMDGGTTWKVVPNVLEARAFGFGAASADYPTIFIVGWVRGIYGIWRSDDNAQSWIQIGNFPLGSLDSIVTIDGDKNSYGTAYIGFSGSGYAYGSVSGVAEQLAKPVVTIKSPENGKAFYGGNMNVNIVVDANDVNGINSITVMVDNTVLQQCANTTSCSATLQGKDIVKRGPHSITATALSKAGVQGEASVTIQLHR